MQILFDNACHSKVALFAIRFVWISLFLQYMKLLQSDLPGQFWLGLFFSVAHYKPCRERSNDNYADYDERARKPYGLIKGDMPGGVDII